MPDYSKLLDLLQKHITLFEDLTRIEQDKLQAARAHDTEGLNECLNKEQAHALLIRGYDRKREALLKELSLEGKTFKELIPLLPDDCRYEFSKAFDELNAAYSLYKNTSDCAKQVIEVNAYRITSVLESLKYQRPTVTSEIYAPDGSLEAEKITFTDIKI